MSTLDQFRERVAVFLSSLVDRRYIPLSGGDAEHPRSEQDYLIEWIHIYLGFEALLDRTPVNPPQLREIVKQIRELQLVREVVECFPYVGNPSPQVCDRDLPVLIFKLQELLEHLDESGSPSAARRDTTKEEQQRSPASRPARPKSKREHRWRSRTNLSPSERRAQTVAKLIEELNRLRRGMTGAESDYDKLARENAHFLTFKIVRKHPGLKETLLNLQGNRRHIRLAQELAGAHWGRELNTIKTDWKKHKPAKYRLSRS